MKGAGAPGQFKGKSIREQLWEELDMIVEHIMSNDEPDSLNYEASDDEDAFQSFQFKEDVRQWGEWRGQAQGVAFALLLMSRPQYESIDDIRAAAMARWEEGQDE